MNPQYTAHPVQPFGPQIVPHSASYSGPPLQQNVYNGLDTNSNPAAKGPGPLGPSYGMAPLSQNGPMVRGPMVNPPPRLGVPPMNLGLQKPISPPGVRSVSPIVPNQLANQVGNLSISQGMPPGHQRPPPQSSSPAVQFHEPPQPGGAVSPYQAMPPFQGGTHQAPFGGPPTASHGGPSFVNSVPGAPPVQQHGQFGGIPGTGMPQHAKLPVSNVQLSDSRYGAAMGSMVPPQYAQTPSASNFNMPPAGHPIPGPPPTSMSSQAPNAAPPGPTLHMQGNYPGQLAPPGSHPLPPLSPPLASVQPGGQANGPLSANAPGQYPGSAPMQARYPPLPSEPPVPQSFDHPGPQPSYPPQPGMVTGGHPGPNRMGMPQPPQQPRRLDLDQMPSPIQVIDDDRKQRSGTYRTNTSGQVPPLVTTDFIVHDEGNCSPRYIRSTIYSVPCNPDILKQTAVPFAITVMPFAMPMEGEYLPPISYTQESGPVRCNRCKAYMCPFMQFIDGGRRFQCVFCTGTTDVPPEYFTHLDHTGQRTDKYERPELSLGSYEFTATKAYCRNEEFPKPPAFIFMIDVSFNSMRNGMAKYLCENMKDVLHHLPREAGADRSTMRVGFVTYSDVVHFYNIKGNLAQPQMLVVSDVHDMFMPLLDGFLVTVDEAESIIDSLMEQIPQMFCESRETETVLGPIIQAGLEALKAAECSGKLLIFHTTLPLAEAPGKLKNRDDRKLLGTDKEKTILTPQTNFYTTLGQECVAAGCCVDLFLFPNAYVDIATIGQVCHLTGGQVYKYSYFQAAIDGWRFLEDLKQDVGKQIAFDTIMRVRTSTGIRPTDFYGNYYMSNTTDIELAAVDSGKAISVQIKYDDKLTEEDGAYVQVAVLFTSCGGQRRLRIHNLKLTTCTQMADLYRNCELDTIVNFVAKQSLHNILEMTPHQIKDSLISRSAQILACYRKNCASPSSAGQLILPECMKLLPLYINCVLKSDSLFGGSDMMVDDRSFMMSVVKSMNVKDSACYFYPRLLPLHTIDTNSSEMPRAIRCSIEKIVETGVYLLENGIHMFMWIGLAVSPDWLQDVFAVQSSSRIDTDRVILMELNTPLSRRVRDVIDRVRQERKRHMRLTLVRQGDKMEIVFRHFLAEDRGSDGSASYVDFLCHLHKEIRSQLS